MEKVSCTSKTTRSGGVRESDDTCAVCSIHTLVHGNPECQVKTTVYCNGHAARNAVVDR